MKVEPRRSKYKKITCQYNQDNVLDIIDIEGTLAKNRFIPKAPIDKFLYSKYLDENNASNDFAISPSIKHNDEIDYNKLNVNKFNINFNTISLEYPNGYSILLVKVYHIAGIIGEGAFGLVISVINRKTKAKEAIKIIEKTKFKTSERNVFEKEVKLINQLNHPRVLKIFEVLDTNDYFFIFMELIEGGSLRDLIVNRYKDKSNDYLFRDSECSIIMSGILEGLSYLHKYRIIHRDIKPENIMLKVKDDLSSVTLCDFGIACRINHDVVQGKCGTALYMAPEIIQKRNYDQLIDSWSAGIVLYILVSGGEHPLYKKTMDQTEFEQTLLKKLQISFPEHIPLLARNLFLKLCKYEPFYRYEPYKALKHPWITRSNRSQIPMTLVEEYQKEGKIKEFKAMLSSSMFFDMFKSIFQIQITQTQPKEDIVNINEVKESQTHYKFNSSINLRRAKIINYNSNLFNNSSSVLIKKIKHVQVPSSDIIKSKKNTTVILSQKKSLFSRNNRSNISYNSQSYNRDIQNITSSNFVLHMKQNTILNIKSNKKNKIFLKNNNQQTSRLKKSKVMLLVNTK